MSFLADVKAVIAIRSPSTTQDDRLDSMIGLAEGQLSSCCFGSQYAYAGALMVLHWLTLEERDGASGAIKSEKEGDLSRTYGVSDSANYWKSTSWGSELQRLKRVKIFTPRTRMMPACGS